MISVLTPTYNRAALLPRLYESLCAQTYRDFEWIVVDDGSTDGTAAAVDGFRKEATFAVRYIHKDNGGKHTALNLGVSKAKGELTFIADSDDMLLPTSLETVASEWQKVKSDPHIGGVAGLDTNMATGMTIGSGLPCDSIDCNAIDIRYRHHVTGDMKEVFRTSVLREHPFPEIEGERFCPEQLVWFRIAQHYKLHHINRAIYLAEYQSGGITAGITKARMRSPIASAMTYAEMLHYPIPLVQKMKAAINYWRFRLCAVPGDSRMPSVGAAWAWARPLGWAMHHRDLSATKE